MPFRTGDFKSPASASSAIPVDFKRISLRMEWWAHQGSNLEPTGYEPVALSNCAMGPTELRIRSKHYYSRYYIISQIFKLYFVVF